MSSGSEQPANGGADDQSLKLAVAISLLRYKILQKQPPFPNPSESDAQRWKRKVFLSLSLSQPPSLYSLFGFLDCFPLQIIFLSLLLSYAKAYIAICCLRFRRKSESKRFSDSEKISSKLKVQKRNSLSLSVSSLCVL